MDKTSSSGEEEEVGPSVDSNDPEERIKARRIRIQKRAEAARRAALGEDPNEKKEIKEELSRSRKQIEQSRQRLTKLLTDGTELVTNTRVAGDAREAARRIEEEENRRQRRDKLEAEAKSGTEKFEEISKKWESALQKEIPQDLHAMLMQQQGACDAMIDEKNKLINEFQSELKTKDDQYVKDLKKQAEDIDLMIERMQEQTKTLTKAYMTELDQVEKAFVTERGEILDQQRKKWETTMQSRRDKEVEYMKAREKRVDDYEQQLQHLRIQDAEEYNSAKIKLETQVQILEQQIQHMRATFQLNQEKLEYNFQVLKKRDEENTITKSQQKRKITRLQDVLNNLKVKLAKQEKQYRDENQQLTEDYKRITEQFRELQKKSKHFIATDTRKFYDIWVMNEEECKTLASKVMEQDRIVCEHQLGLQYQGPDTSFMSNVGPILGDSLKKKQVSATQILQEVLSSTGEENATSEKGSVHDGDQSEQGETVKSTITQKLSPRVIKQILELICDEAGFLVENKLTKLLAPLEKDEQSLMKLDAIFAALGVETEDDIFKLSNHFLKYRTEKPQTQAAMSEKESRKMSVVETQEGGEGVEFTPRSDGVKAPATTTSEDKGTDVETMDDQDAVEAELQRVMEEGEVSTPRSSKTVAEGPDLIHPNEVYKALRAFVEEHWQPVKEKTKQPQFKISNSEDRDDKDDKAYWDNYSSLLPKKTENLWDALLDGLDRYSETLQSRGKLITETDALRQQNAELRMLLHQYINSNVNAELEIPPTRVLNLEMQQV